MVRRWPALLVSLIVLAAVSCGGGGGDGDGGPLDERAGQSDGRGEPGPDGGDEGPAPLTYDETIELSVQDIEEYWADQLPETYDTAYEPVADVRAFDSTDLEGVSECDAGLPYEDIMGNASWCPADDVITFDNDPAGGLLPRLFDEIGTFSIAMVIAHEWGHAIQGRTGVIAPDGSALAPSVLTETQADCFAGSWAARLDRGDSELLVLDPGDLDIGLAGLLEVRDAPGATADTPGAHGSGFDRVNAFQEGFEGGAERCRSWLDNPPLLTEIPFGNIEELVTGGNLPLDEIVPLVLDDLEVYWSGVISPYDPPADVVGYDPAREALLEPCESLSLDPDRPKAYELEAFYCPDDDTIYYDEALFEIVHEEIGDFGVAVLISNAWAAAMQSRLGLEGEPAELALQTDCFSGAWTGSIVYDLHASVIELSPGDLDEVVISFIRFGEGLQSQAADDAFERLDSFSTGFFTDNAEQICAESV